MSMYVYRICQVVPRYSGEAKLVIGIEVGETLVFDSFCERCRKRKCAVLESTATDQGGQDDWVMSPVCPKKRRFALRLSREWLLMPREDDIGQASALLRKRPRGSSLPLVHLLSIFQSGCPSQERGWCSLQRRSGGLKYRHGILQMKIITR
jgi:hypothetical protein